VNVTFTLYNDRDQPIRGIYDVGLGNVGTKLYYRKVGGEFVTYFTGWIQALLQMHGTTLPWEIAPHGKSEATNRLFYNTNLKSFVLAEPGEYEFKATFNLLQPVERFPYESSIVRIKVIEPPESEREASANLSDPELAQFVEGDWQLGLVEARKVEAGAEKAVAFVGKYNNSIYASLVRQQLKFVLTEASRRRDLTPKLKELLTSLPQQ
jgi:hypothetical protein